MQSIQAQVMAMAQVTLEVKFIVHITGPVEMPIFEFATSAAEVIVHNKDKREQYILNRLMETIIHFYNKRVENSPLLDMLDDPDRFKKLYSVNITEMNYNLGLSRTVS